jgi:predicted dienelactone hydrolase
METGYDPFARGPFNVAVRSFEALDEARNRLFPCDVWEPDNGSGPLVVYSHHSMGHRRRATFLCEHLASHGYVVAALDHSESAVPELGRQDGESGEQKAARVQEWIASRVPDVRFLLDSVAADAPVGIVGHSFGGWTALAAPDVEPRIRSVVAHAPGGIANPRPGVIPATLSFAWGREVPTLYLAAEYDTPLPLTDMYELYERIPAPKRIAVLRRADHQHFADDVEQSHEAARSMELPPELAWMQAEMRPISELCSGEEAHLFVRGLTLAHLDATLLGRDDAQRFLDHRLM